MQETPWLTFEESINRYRVQGTMFAERESLIPGPSEYKGVQARGTATVYSMDEGKSRVRLSGFYSYGWESTSRTGSWVLPLRGPCRLHPPEHRFGK